MKKDLNYIAGLEKAISKKYGEEAVQNPSANWTPEKEKEYLQQLKENKIKEMTKDRVEEREGFLFSAKLIKKDSKNIWDQEWKERAKGRAEWTKYQEKNIKPT